MNPMNPMNPMKLFLTIPALAVLAFAPAALAADAKADLAKGEKLYQANCAMCHGATGHGDGPAAAALKPAPRDLVAGKYAHGMSQADVAKTLEAGIEGTAMMSYKGTLKAGELEAVAAYVVSLQKGDAKKAAPKK